MAFALSLVGLLVWLMVADADPDARPVAVALVPTEVVDADRPDGAPGGDAPFDPIAAFEFSGPDAWRAHVAPFDLSDPRPRLAIVVGGLGLLAEAAISDLPGGVTLAFLPYGRNVDLWVRRAREAGHEVLLDLPMEPTNYPIADPGPNALLTALTPEENLERLDWTLTRASEFVGVASHMGSRFLASSEALAPVLDGLRNRGMVFLNRGADEADVAVALARDHGVVSVTADVAVDVGDPTVAQIDQRLAQATDLAQQRGTAIALAQPYPLAMERIALWVADLEAKGVVLAPVSAVIDRTQPQ